MFFWKKSRIRRKTGEKDREIKEIIEYYAGQKEPKDQENLTAMLREIQETEGWIPSEACRMAAEKLGVKESVLNCIIKLYPSLKAAPYVHESGERPDWNVFTDRDPVG